MEAAEEGSSAAAGESPTPVQSPRSKYLRHVLPSGVEMTGSNPSLVHKSVRNSTEMTAPSGRAGRHQDGEDHRIPGDVTACLSVGLSF